MDVLHKILTIAFEKGISDKELCEKIGVYNSAISEWKKGKTQSYMKHLDKIAFVLGVSVSDLIETEQKENPLAQFSPETVALVERISQLSPDMAKKALEYIDFIAQKK
jgi:transcriptional regulator with XRE-family HTH domain